MRSAMTSLLREYYWRVGRQAQPARRLPAEALAPQAGQAYLFAAGMHERAQYAQVIGFGSGPLFDGQMLSTEEMLGLAPSGRGMREIKVYAALGRAVMGAARLFAREVKKGEYLR